MDEKLEYLIYELSDCIEKDGLDYKFSRDPSNLSSFLVSELMDEVDLSSNELRGSSYRIKQELASAVTEAESNDNSVKSFEEAVEEIEAEINDEQVREFTVAFPLNISPDYCDIDQIKVGDVNFSQISNEEWSTKFVPEYKQHADDSHVMSVLWNYAHQLPVDLDDPSFTYWKASYYARDSGFATNKIIQSLSILLGKINYTIHEGKPLSYSPNPWPDRYSNIVHPFIYFKKNSNGFFGGFRVGDVESCLLPTECPSTELDDASEIALPNFTSDTNLDPRITSAIAAYQSGITASTNEISFFSFWRGIESLASFSRDDSSGKIGDRCRAWLAPEDEELNDLLIRRLYKKRNEYVHEAGSTPITIYDRDISKLLLESLIEASCKYRNNWNVDDWRFFLDNSSSSTEPLQRKIESRKREIEILDQLKRE